MNKLNEATNVGGAIDKLYANIEKSITQIMKAQDAVLSAATSMDAVLESAKSVGGSLEGQITTHIMNHMNQLTNNIAESELGGIIEGGGQGALKSLLELIESTPIRDVMQQSAAKNVQNVSNMPNMNPNLSGGPQSQISSSYEKEMAQTGEDLESFYRRKLQEEAEGFQYDDRTLNFNVLQESNIFGTQFETDMMEGLKMKTVAPIATKQVREKMRVAADDDMREDIESLQESGPLDFTKLRPIGGKDGMPLSFNSLREGANLMSVRS